MHRDNAIRLVAIIIVTITVACGTEGQPRSTRVLTMASPIPASSQVISPTRASNPTPVYDYIAANTGIYSAPFDEETSIIVKRNMLVENFWRGWPDGFENVVVAGASVDSPGWGIVNVGSYKHYQSAVGFNRLDSSLTPTRHGSVHIVAVNLPYFTLIAADGTVFTYNYTAYTFV